MVWNETTEGITIAAGSLVGLALVLFGYNAIANERIYREVWAAQDEDDAKRRKDTTTIKMSDKEADKYGQNINMLMQYEKYQDEGKTEEADNILRELKASLKNTAFGVKRRTKKHHRKSKKSKKNKK
jgi:hypothetical protein